MSLDLIKSLMTETVEIVRVSAEVTWVDGEPVRGAEETLSAPASIQPLTPNERLLLPEHVRTRETVKMYMETLVRTLDEKNNLLADRIIHDGKTYEVQGVENWHIGTDLPHYKVICVKLDGEGGGDAAE